MIVREVEGERFVCSGEGNRDWNDKLNREYMKCTNSNSFHHFRFLAEIAIQCIFVTEGLE